MKRFTKKRNAIIAFVLISTVAISAMLINNSLLVEANELFSGIDSIISYNSEANPFNIVELVPEEKMAEIGYLMDGEEPEQWLSSISTMVSSSDDSGYNKRTKYVNDLKTKLTSIIETNGTKTKPLHYSDYEESYVSSSGLIRLPLANEDVIEKDTTGYKINDVGTGNGAYEFNCDYTPVATGGNYDQNVDYYIYSGAGYYGVVFEGVLLDGISSIAEQLAGRKAYSVKNSHAYVNKSSLEGLASDKPNAYVYKSDNSDIS